MQEDIVMKIVTGYLGSKFTLPMSMEKNLIKSFKTLSTTIYFGDEELELHWPDLKYLIQSPVG